MKKLYFLKLKTYCNGSSSTKTIPAAAAASASDCFASA
jgi:hypothetical protein